MSTRRCGASCAASSTTRAPAAWAISTTSAIGSTSPVTLEAPVTATNAAGRARGGGGRGAGAEGGGERRERGGHRGARGHHAARSPRQQLGVVLDVEAHDLAGHGGGQQ